MSKNQMEPQWKIETKKHISKVENIDEELVTSL